MALNFRAHWSLRKEAFGSFVVCFIKSLSHSVVLLRFFDLLFNVYLFNHVIVLVFIQVKKCSFNLINNQPRIISCDSVTPRRFRLSITQLRNINISWRTQSLFSFLINVILSFIIEQRFDHLIILLISKDSHDSFISWLRLIMRSAINRLLSSNH